jgi:hypothetical protein
MKLIIFLLVFCFSISMAYAHPWDDLEDMNWCHVCHTNCEQYGLYYWELHCHKKEACSFEYSLWGKNVIDSNGILELQYPLLKNLKQILRNMNSLNQAIDATKQWYFWAIQAIRTQYGDATAETEKQVIQAMNNFWAEIWSAPCAQSILEVETLIIALQTQMFWKIWADFILNSNQVDVNEWSNKITYYIDKNYNSILDKVQKETMTNIISIINATKKEK